MGCLNIRDSRLGSLMDDMKCLQGKSMFLCPLLMVTNKEKDYSNVIRYVK